MNDPDNLKDITRLLGQVRRTIKQFAMFEPQQRVLVAVSGGPDSMALLNVLIQLSPFYQLRLGIAHLNHGLRPEAAEMEAALVQQEADRSHLPLYIKKVHIDSATSSLEERARQVRYDFFEHVAQNEGYHKIALGHQADDNAEAVLMHLIRGSGIRGLSGIPPVRDGRYVRPLIQVSRRDLIRFLKAKKISYALDASNEDPRFLRNRIRHELIPQLSKNYNPNIVATLTRTAAICLDEERWFQSFLAPFMEKAVICETKNHLELSLETINSLETALQRRILRHAVCRWRGSLRRISADHIESLLTLLHPERKKGFANMPGGWKACRTGRRLLFVKGKKEFRNNLYFEYQVSSPEILPMELMVPEADLKIVFSRVPAPDSKQMAASHEKTAWFDLDQVSFPLVIRNFRPGDRITLLGMTGSRKLKKIFNECHIAHEQRLRIPVLESAGRILWVAGVQRSRWATISGDTQRIVQVGILF
jgi:tRNA(Ile)-lysidine synthase